jgi:uncharacterized protein (UPF0261 family)
MRTTPEENRRLGEILAEKLNASTGPVTVLLPTRGLSVIDTEGGPFWWPEADGALFESLKQNLDAKIPIVEMDCDVNAPAFAERAAAVLLELMAEAQTAR